MDQMRQEPQWMAILVKIGTGGWADDEQQMPVLKRDLAELSSSKALSPATIQRMEDCFDVALVCC